MTTSTRREDRAMAAARCIWADCLRRSGLADVCRSTPAANREIVVRAWAKIIRQIGRDRLTTKGMGR